VWLPEHDSAPLPHQLELMRTMAEQPAAAGKAAKKEKSAPVKDKVATPAEKAATTPPVTKPTEKAFEGASLVRLRLRGAPIVELPKSLTDKPRRSSAVRPLPHTHLGAATAAAYEEREKIAQTRPPKVEAKSAVPPSPKEPPKRERSTSDAASGSAEGAAAEGGAPSAGRGTKASAKAKASAVVSAAGGKGSSGGGDGDDDESGGGEGSAGKVTIANGPHSGKEAKVLHVGNGWVKLQLPSGSIVHMRKWDLHGDIPLKMRSPTKQPKDSCWTEHMVERQPPAAHVRESRDPPSGLASSSIAEPSPPHLDNTIALMQSNQIHIRLHEPLWSTAPPARPMLGGGDPASHEQSRHVGWAAPAMVDSLTALDMIDSNRRAERGFCKAHRPVPLSHLSNSERQNRATSLMNTSRLRRVGY